VVSELRDSCKLSLEVNFCEKTNDGKNYGNNPEQLDDEMNGLPTISV
jgi:hypothetical protein